MSANHFRPGMDLYAGSDGCINLQDFPFNRIDRIHISKSLKILAYHERRRSPSPAAEIACFVLPALTSPAANTPSIEVLSDSVIFTHPH